MKLVIVPYFLALSVISGCAIYPPVPSDVGVGRYLHYFKNGSLIMQGNFKEPYDCDATLRGSWSENIRAGMTTKCSETDMSYRLAYGIAITKPEYGKIEASAFLTNSNRVCENMASYASTTNTGFTKHCDNPNEIVTVDSGVVAVAPSVKPVSVEEQLRELKRLFDAGLLSKEIYLDRQKNVLDKIK